MFCKAGISEIVLTWKLSPNSIGFSESLAGGELAFPQTSNGQWKGG